MKIKWLSREFICVCWLLYHLTQNLLMSGARQALQGAKDVMFEQPPNKPRPFCG